MTLWTPAYQAAIVQAVEEAIEEMKPEMKNIDETSKQALVDGGMTLIEYDDSFYQEILALDTVQALYDKIDADVNGLGTTLQGGACRRSGLIYPAIFRLAAVSSCCSS